MCGWWQSGWLSSQLHSVQIISFQIDGRKFTYLAVTYFAEILNDSSQHVCTSRLFQIFRSRFRQYRRERHHAESPTTTSSKTIDIRSSHLKPSKTIVFRNSHSLLLCYSEKISSIIGEGHVSLGFSQQTVDDAKFVAKIAAHCHFSSPLEALDR